MKPPACLNDLVIRARRSQLSQLEQLRLREHLAVCAACRLDQQIGADFDAIGRLRPGDHALVDNLADKVMRRRRGGRGARARPGPLWMAAGAACALFAAVAGADILLGHRLATRPAPTSIPIPAQPTIAREPAQSAANPAAGIPGSESPVPAASLAEVLDPRGLARSFPSRPRSAGTAPSSSPTESRVAQGQTASALFESANTERRRNHIGQAILLYDQLQKQHPATEEAHVSQVSLGRLLLDREQWTEGLSQLNEYLSTSPDGQLAPEALFGKARALSALGRHDEERAEWNRLLMKFPESVYAAEARRRGGGLR